MYIQYAIADWSDKFKIRLFLIFTWVGGKTELAKKLFSGCNKDAEFSHLSSPLECVGEGDFVRVFHIGADGEAAAEAGDIDV